MGYNSDILGFLTLGQSPRSDVIPTFLNLLHPNVIAREAGALDGLSEGQINALSPVSAGNGIETRLSKGRSVIVDKGHLLPLLIQQAVRLQEQCDYVVLLCSGEFPELRSACSSIIEPIILLRGIIYALAGRKTLGIIGPKSDLALAPSQWQPYVRNVVCTAASPYGKIDVIAQAAISSVKQGAEIILLDDMGFTEEQRLVTQKSARIPVVCATTMTARVLAEVMCHGK